MNGQHIPSFTFGFFGEGVRDYAFLVPIIQRLLDELMPPVEINDGIWFDDLNTQDMGDADKLANVFHAAQGYQLVVYHLDADTNGRKGLEKALQRFQTAYATARQSPDVQDAPLVPIIPVVMTEAWMLVDFATFKDIVGTKHTADELDFPAKPAKVENIRNPKAVFEQAIRRAGSGRRHPPSPDDVYLPLARRIPLKALQEVPAFHAFKQSLADFLREHNYLDV